MTVGAIAVPILLDIGGSTRLRIDEVIERDKTASSSAEVAAGANPSPTYLARQDHPRASPQPRPTPLHRIALAGPRSFGIAFAVEQAVAAYAFRCDRRESSPITAGPALLIQSRIGDVCFRVPACQQGSDCVAMGGVLRNQCSGPRSAAKTVSMRARRAGGICRRVEQHRYSGGKGTDH